MRETEKDKQVILLMTQQELDMLTMFELILDMVSLLEFMKVLSEVSNKSSCIMVISSHHHIQMLRLLMLLNRLLFLARHVLSIAVKDNKFLLLL